MLESDASSVLELTRYNFVREVSAYWYMYLMVVRIVCASEFTRVCPVCARLSSGTDGTHTSRLCPALLGFCALLDVSLRRLCVLPGWQMNVNVNVHSSGGF